MNVVGSFFRGSWSGTDAALGQYNIAKGVVCMWKPQGCNNSNSYSSICGGSSELWNSKSTGSMDVYNFFIFASHVLIHSNLISGLSWSFSFSLVCGKEYKVYALWGTSKSWWNSKNVILLRHCDCTYRLSMDNIRESLAK